MILLIINMIDIENIELIILMMFIALFLAYVYRRHLYHNYDFFFAILKYWKKKFKQIGML